MHTKGDCLSCDLVAKCSETSVDKVLESYTCLLFSETPEAVFQARVEMMHKYGERIAVEAMLKKPEEEEPEDGGPANVH